MGPALYQEVFRLWRNRRNNYTIQEAVQHRAKFLIRVIKGQEAWDLLRPSEGSEKGASPSGGEFKLLWKDGQIDGGNGTAGNKRKIKESKEERKAGHVEEETSLAGVEDGGKSKESTSESEKRGEPKASVAENVGVGSWSHRVAWGHLLPH